ncbi:MAG: pilin [Acidimicrobiales bacterium]
MHPRTSQQSLEQPRSRRPRLRRLACRSAQVAVPAAVVAAVLLVAIAPPAFAATGGAATSLNSVIDNLRNWLVGILAAVATLFLTVGGLRYLTAGGDPSQVEKAKTALKSAAIGYALAALAPLLVSILASLF